MKGVRKLSQNHGSKGFIVVSNRLPVVLEEQNGTLSVKSGSGGLISALSPALRDRGGSWIGWLGTSETVRIKHIKSLLGPISSQSGYRLLPIFMTHQEVKLFYQGFCNEIVWPLFHDLQSRCRFDPTYWDTYLKVNQKFAKVTVKHSDRWNLIWVNDYHLIPLGKMLRDKRPNCAFFLHIPFPPPDIFMKLPWRQQVMEQLLSYRLTAFQTDRDADNFLRCFKELNPRSRVMTRKGGGRGFKLSHQWETVVGAFPISIDFRYFEGLAKSPAVRKKADQIRRAHQGRRIMLGIDRLDYTKGILERFRAFELLLQRDPSLLGKVTLVQLLVPSREDVTSYRNLREEIDREAGRIIGRFATLDWIPITYMYQSVGQEDLAALYRAAHVGLVTSLKDGMNLVSKEYCACHPDNDGVLILSEFAGSAVELGAGAITVNPYDMEGMANAMQKALFMPDEERKRRMSLMRRRIKGWDVFRWMDSFLNTAAGLTLSSLPKRELPPIIRRPRAPLDGGRGASGSV